MVNRCWACEFRIGLIASLRPAFGHGWRHYAGREAVKTTGSAAVHRRGAASLRHA